MPTFTGLVKVIISGFFEIILNGSFGWNIQLKLVIIIVHFILRPHSYVVRFGPHSDHPNKPKYRNTPT